MEKPLYNVVVIDLTAVSHSSSEGQPAPQWKVSPVSTLHPCSQLTHPPRPRTMVRQGPGPGAELPPAEIKLCIIDRHLSHLMLAEV